MRIAPKPSRLTVRSPPNFQVGFVAMFGDADDSAPKIASDPLARSAALVTSVVPRNVRRVIPVFSFESEDFSCMLSSVRPRKLLSTELFCTLVAKSKAAEHRTHSKTQARIQRRKLRLRFGVRRCCAALQALDRASFTCPLSSLNQCFLPLAHQNGECLLEISAES